MAQTTKRTKPATATKVSAKPSVAARKKASAKSAPAPVSPSRAAKQWVGEYKLATVVVVVVFGVLFAARGWFRVTVFPKSAMPFYKHGVQNELTAQNSALHYPMAKLGIATSPSRYTCALDVAQSVHTEVNCQATLQGYAKLPQTAADKLTVQANAQQLQALLASQGWRGGGNGVTITSLINGAYQGTDSSPDAYYEKVIGHNDCVFDTRLAYAKPQLPAISSSLWCARTVNVLGAPSNETYNSSKGTPAY